MPRSTRSRATRRFVACVSGWIIVTTTAWIGAAESNWEPPAITVPRIPSHPAIACSHAELQRLRTAYHGSGPAHDAIASIVATADRALRQPVHFPPRGGQHNQWYQCDKCQIALQTIDATHHRCPRCKTVYSGEPYDDVVFSRVHGRNLQNMLEAAWGYAITGKPEYARYAREVLLGYAARYRKYPYHSASRSLIGWASRSGGHLYEQTLTEASAFVRTIAPAYDLIHDWSGLTAADHDQIRSGLLLPILQNIDRNHAGKSNWQTWHNAAFIWGGALLGDAAWVRKAITDPRNGFVFQMNTSVTADGMWFENSWGYHFYTLSAMVQIAEVARHLDMDLWSHPALKKMFTVAFQYVMPNGRFPRFGDDVNTSIDSMSGVLEYAYHAYGDPAMRPYLTVRPTRASVMFGRPVIHAASPPRLGSHVFHAAGHAILRTDGQPNLAAAMTFGPYGGFHGHLDKLSFVFFGYKQELAYDPGRARSQAYRLPIHRDWYKATLGHNTVLVDQKSQKPAAGHLDFFAANDHCAAVVASCTDAYPGVCQHRLLYMTRTYLLVVDQLDSDTRHRFDWTYHHRAARIQCAAADQSVAALGADYAGQEYVAHIEQGRTDAPVHAAFVDKNVTTYLTAAAAPATTVYTGDGVGASVVDRVPMIMLTRHARNTHYATVLEPVSMESGPEVTGVELHTQNGTLSVVVHRGNRLDTVTCDTRYRCTVTTHGVAEVWTKTLGKNRRQKIRNKK